MVLIHAKLCFMVLYEGEPTDRYTYTQTHTHASIRPKYIAKMPIVSGFRKLINMTCYLICWGSNFEADGVTVVGNSVYHVDIYVLQCLKYSEHNIITRCGSLNYSTTNASVIFNEFTSYMYLDNTNNVPTTLSSGDSR